MAINAQNCQHQLYGANSDVPARTPPKGVHDEGCASPRFMCGEQSRLDGTQQDAGTEGESLKISRRHGRRIRRDIRRLEKRWARNDALGGLKGVFTFHDLYKAGQKCCNGVRWKQSVQNFETRLFSGTAARRKAVIEGRYKFSSYVHFLLSERGKIRPIDAPRIQDRQVEKTYTQKVLLPLYLPSMIWNNGASLPGKGFHFSRKQLENELRAHFRRYGRHGGIILTDGKKFFPSANHEKIYKRHNRIILDDSLRAFGDDVVQTVKEKVGMPLGVEPSQAEMIAYPSSMDNYMKCQMRLKGYGHYMDDFYILVPPDRDYKEILKALKVEAKKCGVTLGESKTKYLPLTRSFRYCKAKYILTATGKVVVRANRTTERRDARKIRAFFGKFEQNKMTLEDVWTSVNGMMAYLETYDEHKTILRLRQQFFRLFGFSCERYENFKQREV